MISTKKIFSLDNFTQLAKSCSANADNIPVDDFCALLDSIVLLL